VEVLEGLEPRELKKNTMMTGRIPPDVKETFNEKPLRLGVRVGEYYKDRKEGAWTCRCLALFQTRTGRVLKAPQGGVGEKTRFI